MAAGQQARKRDWTIRDMLDWCAGYLQKHGDPDPRGSAQWLVSHATGLEKIELYLDLDRVLNAGELDFMRDAVRRRAKGEPLQYLTGSAPFRFITVEVAPGVLIPRPETEVLVSTLLDMLPAAPRRVATDSLTADELERLISVQKTVDGTDDARATDGVAAGGEGASAGVDDQEFAPAFIEAPAPGQAPAEDAEEGVAPHASTDAASSASAASTQGVSSAAPASTRSTRATNGRAAAESPTVSAASLQVLEIGTGSGCIACSLASERPDIRVTATDISATAAELARRNAQRIGVADRVEVVQCDLGAGLPASERGAYDGLISNPPYIPTKVYDGLDTEVHDYEPRIALDGGADGLDFFRRLLPFGLQWLKPDAPFTVELHEDALDEAKRLAEAAGYAQVRIVDDMAGRHRIIAARTPQR